MAAQLPDSIILQGEKLDLYSNPLEKYWQTKNRKRPEFHATPICKRGYIATWEILDKHLILRSVDGNIEKRFLLFWSKTVRFTLKMMFSKARAGVRATWFTGKIRVPLGKRMLYVHNEYDSRFEREMVITIDKGAVIRTVTLDNVAQKLLIETN